MEGNGWRPSQGELVSTADEGGSADWRTEFPHESRQKIVDKITNTLKRHLSIPASDGSNELQQIAIQFENKIYTAAANQNDYLRKISMKMLSMESKSQQSAPINPSTSNNTVTNQNPSESASLGIQSQPNNQGQSSLSIPSQQLLPQNIQNNTSVTASSPANLPSAVPITGLSQSAISSVSQSSSLQTMPGTNTANNTLGKTAVSDIYANVQRQIQGRQQQQQFNSQQQHQPQNQFLHQHQINQQLLKQKMQHSSLLQSHVQQQQQSLMQTTKPQSSQHPLMQMPSNLQTGQSTVQQMQPREIQSSEQPSFQQNQLSSVEQSAPSLLQQHPQSIGRQQQQQQQTTTIQQTPSMQQLQNSASQQSHLPMQQNQQLLMGQQANISSVQQTKQLGQQTGMTEMQQRQKRMLVQQNNILTMQQSQHLLNQQTISSHQQQQLGAQSSIQQSQQQQQLLGSLPNISNMQSHQRPMHMLQQSKTVVKQQQKNQQTPLAMLQQGQQSQHQSSQQQLVPQFQSQPAQLQQSLAQLHPGSLQREMQQRMQASGALLSQNAIEQQKQFFLSQRGLPEVSSSTSLDSTAQTGHDGVVDWQEEIYQKIKSMKEIYFEELKEVYQRILLKMQHQSQSDALILSGKATEHAEKMKNFKTLVERAIQMLQISKSNIQPGMKDKLPAYEKQIINLLASNKKKLIPSQLPGQQKFQPPAGHPQSMSQKQSSQVPQLQQHENYINQQINLQGSANSMHPASVPNMQQGAVNLATHFGIPTPQQNATNILQTGPTVDPVQGNSFSSLQQGTIASMQQGGLLPGQSAIDVPQLSNSMSLNSMSSLQNNINSKQPSSSTIQQQHFKQQQQQELQQHLMQNQQLKQPYQQRHMQQQLIQQQQKQRLLQVQQPLQQQMQQQKQQTSRMPMQQMPQLHQTNEINELKLRQGTGIKPDIYQQHYSTGQRHNYYQQLKPGSSFPISSPQTFQVSSPQISQYSSSQLDQQSPLSSQMKSGTPLQSANSPLTPSPSTPIAPSPIPGESEKQHSGTPLPNAGHIGHQQTAAEFSQAQSVAVATPGISASPLLAEFSSDGNQTNTTNLVAGKETTTQKPFERIIEVIQSSTPEALSSAISDIGSVVSMVDKLAGSAPGNGSRAVIGEDLVAMTKSHLQARSLDGDSKKMKRDTSAMPLNNVSSAGSLNDSFKQSYGFDTSELESTATSHVKRQKVEVSHAVYKEIKEINLRLINTLVNISEEDNDSISAALDGEGTVIKCFFTAIALCPSLKSHFASNNMSPILPLRLLVPANYPECSPVLLDKLLDEQRESDDLSLKARSRFITSLGMLSQPISLQEMARTWDACASEVILEFAQQIGGGTFSSRYGTWESCVGA
ncbi:mediator of RNA polymerase II transcription subunit 15a [Canna indica]|uniref:Mediator of RNA polymerase II transcription subunit 15a n=1 Tax=Canna indica TaxID=4628 RepID=A0AAQ3QL20_9LILI|nr:mediator of RNA polymerase II transcription subunit 15a [Canna indica]